MGYGLQIGVLLLCHRQERRRASLLGAGNPSTRRALKSSPRRTRNPPGLFFWVPYSFGPESVLATARWSVAPPLRRGH